MDGTETKLNLGFFVFQPHLWLEPEDLYKIKRMDHSHLI